MDRDDEWEVVGSAPREADSGPAQLSITPCSDLNANGEQRVMVQVRVPSDAGVGGAAGSAEGAATGGAADAAAAAAVPVPVPPTVARAPVDVCCVVDVSASMSDLATYEKDGQLVSDGLSILNLVQHAVKTGAWCQPHAPSRPEPPPQSITQPTPQSTPQPQPHRYPVDG